MKIDFQKDATLGKIAITEKEAKKILEQVFAVANIDCSKKAVEIFLVGSEKIRLINRNFRNLDQPTDVLSFPQEQIKAAEFNILGSIFISPEVAAERGEELSDLLIHGAIHLLGYDHEKDEKKWQKFENKVYNK